MAIQMLGQHRPSTAATLKILRQRCLVLGLHRVCVDQLLSGSGELATATATAAAAATAGKYHHRVADLPSPPSSPCLLHKARQPVRPPQMDDVDHAGNINARPERPSRHNPPATATGPLLEQLLLASGSGLVKWTLHLLGHTLALSIAADVDDPSRPWWQWQLPDQRLSRLPDILLARDHLVPDSWPHGRLPVDLRMLE